MFAESNSLNKLIEVPNLIPNHLVLNSCGFDSEEGVYALRFDPTTEEYAGFGMFAPKDLLPVGNVTIKLLWWPWIDNATGSDKAVIWRLRTNEVHYGVVIGAGTIHSDVTGIIPDGEARLTPHLDTLGVIANINPYDYMSIELRRKAAEAGDTWASDAVANAVIIAEYVSTLLKKV